MVRAGSLTSPAQTRLDVDDLRSERALRGARRAAHARAPGSVLLAGADGGGANLTASVSIAPDAGNGLAYAAAKRRTIRHGSAHARHRLRQPHPRHARRNRTERSARQRRRQVAFQSFKLKKKPLTYLNDESASNGRRSTLAVRVNAILWTEVGSFLRSRATGRSLYRAAK